MKFEFIADWGFKHIYFREDYLPTIDFSGKISVEGGVLTDITKTSFRFEEDDTLNNSYRFYFTGGLKYVFDVRARSSTLKVTVIEYNG